MLPRPSSTRSILLGITSSHRVQPPRRSSPRRHRAPPSSLADDAHGASARRMRHRQLPVLPFPIPIDATTTTGRRAYYSSMPTTRSAVASVVHRRSSGGGVASSFEVPPVRRAGGRNDGDFPSSSSSSSSPLPSSRPVVVVVVVPPSFSSAVAIADRPTRGGATPMPTPALPRTVYHAVEHEDTAGGGGRRWWSEDYDEDELHYRPLERTHYSSYYGCASSSFDEPDGMWGGR